MNSRSRSVPPTSRITLGAATISALAAALLIAVPALAYQYPLSTTDIRSAYMLGNRNDDVTTDFLAQYRRELPCLKVART